MEDVNLNDSPEVDKRLALFKKMKRELIEEESKEKEDHQRQKMADLDQKIQELEDGKRAKQEKEEADKKQAAAVRSKGNSNFLGNIKSYNVDDI